MEVAELDSPSTANDGDLADPALCNINIKWHSCSASAASRSALIRPEALVKFRLLKSMGLTMIIRHWRGWTTPDKADAYEELLREEIFPQVRQRTGQGLRGIELLRRQCLAEVEFVTLLRFTSLQAIKALTGDNYETAFVPEAARQLLSHFDERAAHYELR